MKFNRGQQHRKASNNKSSMGKRNGKSMWKMCAHIKWKQEANRKCMRSEKKELFTVINNRALCDCVWVGK